MKSIYFINDRINLHGLSWDESLKKQEEEILSFIEKENIQIIKLNHYQVYNHYTVLHALLYDLKRSDIDLEYLIIYSQKVLEDFTSSYPARWLLIKSYFNTIISIHS